jgi:serine/threonine protein kinase HipA of HipAB toxin-antitoxin module
MDGGFETRVDFCRRDLRRKQERPLSKHDTPTKRKRRPKSDKRVDYTARTMAAIKQHSDAEKLSDSHAVVMAAAV